MRCAWQEFISLLPVWMRKDVDRLGSETLQELRLRIGYGPELVRSNGEICLDRLIEQDDMSFIINAASNYSPWTTSTIGQGYLTARGGHRIGVFGTATVHNGIMTGVSNVTSLCIRVARDFRGLSAKLWDEFRSVLILGRPGSGKTTLLRDLIRCRSSMKSGSVAVIDEKGELFPWTNTGPCFETGKRTDVLTGCCKPQGIEAALRNMGPSVIAVDEITAQEDCTALIHAGWCGVDIFATAHAADIHDLLSRPVYRSIVNSGLFSSVVVLRSDKTWYVERIST